MLAALSPLSSSRPAPAKSQDIRGRAKSLMPLIQSSGSSPPAFTGN